MCCGFVNHYAAVYHQREATVIHRLKEGVDISVFNGGGGLTVVLIVNVDRFEEGKKY